MRRKYILLKYIFIFFGIDLLSRIDSREAEIFRLIRSIKKERKFLMLYNEALNLYRAVVNTKNVDGHIAEVGAFNGASAKLMAIARDEIKLSTKEIHIYDSFEGLPDTIEEDAKQFKKGQFQSDYNVVTDYLAEYKNLFIYKGFFPQKNSESIEDKQFSLVNLDVDLYESTLDSLKFFYPRMSKGGVIISHDYAANGVRKAFDEYFSSIHSPRIELYENQVIVVKI